MSPDHLIEYWSVLDGQTVHPDDQAVLPPGQFAVDLEPLPWNGPLRSARAYILFINPGLPPDGVSPDDYEYEQRPVFREALRFNLTGNSPYIYLHANLRIIQATVGPADYSVGTLAKSRLIGCASSNSLHTTAKTVARRNG